MCTWLAITWWKDGKPSLVGALTGAVAGLACITPAAGYVPTWAAFIFGLLAGSGCYFAVRFKDYMKWDDALDVWACHGVGGVLGTILLGVFALKSVNPAGADGLIAGNWSFFGWQVLATVVIAAYAFVATFLILKLINAFGSIRVPDSRRAAGAGRGRARARPRTTSREVRRRRRPRGAAGARGTTGRAGPKGAAPPVRTYGAGRRPVRPRRARGRRDAPSDHAGAAESVPAGLLRPGTPAAPSALSQRSSSPTRNPTSLPSSSVSTRCLPDARAAPRNQRATLTPVTRASGTVEALADERLEDDPAVGESRDPVALDPAVGVRGASVRGRLEGDDPLLPSQRDVVAQGVGALLGLRRRTGASRRRRRRP